MNFHANLTAALLEFSKAGRSGVVRLEQGTVKKQLVIKLGFLAYCESNVPEEHLARVMVRMSLLPRSALPRISVLMQKGGATDEAICTAAELDPQTLREGIQEQALAIMVSLMETASGEIQTYPGDTRGRRVHALKMPLPDLLVQAARRAAAAGRVPKAFESASATILPAADPSVFMELPLDSAEALAHSLVQTPTRINDLVPLLPPGIHKPEDLITRLLLLGLLEKEEPAAKKEVVDQPEPATQGKLVEEMLVRFQVANLYEILSLSPDASEQEIKDAYYELAKQYHPDRFQSAAYKPELRSSVEKIFAHMTGAYTTLSDPASRALYDKTRLKNESSVESALKARSGADTERDRMAAALYRAGRSSLVKGDFEKATEQLKECVWLSPGNPQYRHYLGVAQTEITSMRKEAEQHLLKAVELDATHIDSFLALAKLYLKVGLPRKAEVCLLEFLQWDAGNRQARSMLEKLQQKMTRPGPAHRLRLPFSRS